MRRRWKLVLGCLLGAIGVSGAIALALGWRPSSASALDSWLAESPVRVGLIHSLTGSLR